MSKESKSDTRTAPEATVTDVAAELAHEKIEALQEKLKEAEQQLRSGAQTASEAAEHYGTEAKAVANDQLDSVEKYIREKPLQAAGIAFAAGLVTAMILRK